MIPQPRRWAGSAPKLRLRVLRLLVPCRSSVCRVPVVVSGSVLVLLLCPVGAGAARVVVVAAARSSLRAVFISSSHVAL